jgi:predicted NBD/HSP70 family sugar kinase
MTRDSKTASGVAQRVLGYLAAHPNSSRDQIAAGIGCDRSTVFRCLPDRTGPNNLRILVDGNGDRPELFRLKSDVTPLLVAVDIGAHHWRITSTLTSEAQHPESGDWDADRDPHGALDGIATRIQECYAVDDIQLILVGVPFPVREDKQILGDGNWSGLTVRREMAERLGRAIRVRIESDVNLGAIAELEAAKQRHDPDHAKSLSLLYVKWSSKVRAATVIGGQLHNGDGLADSYLHSPLRPSVPGDPGDCPTCRGHCTATFASLKAVFDDLGDIEGPNTEARAQQLLMRAADDPAGEAARRLTEAARALGRSLGHAANTMVPDHIVLGGAFERGAIWDVRTRLVEGFEEVVAPAIAARMSSSVENGTYTGAAAITGAKIAVAEEFGPALWELYKRRKSR